MINFVNSGKASWIIHPDQRGGKPAYLKPGEIIELRAVDGQVMIVRSDGQNPVGVLERISLDEGIVQFTQHIGMSSMYDTTPNYQINALLYTMHGLFTTTQYLPTYRAVAMVVEPPTAARPFLHHMWL